MLISDIEQRESVVLLPPLNTTRPKDSMRRDDHACPILTDEKNWAPLVQGQNHAPEKQVLLFVYQHVPLQVLRFDAPNATSLQGGALSWMYKAPSNAGSPTACLDVRGGTQYLHWRAHLYVALGHVHCGVITDVGCRMPYWDSDSGHCNSYRRTPMSWNHSCSRAYRTVLTVLDTSTWQLTCSPRLRFAPPPFLQCTRGWRGKWDVQYVLSLQRSSDGEHMLVGMEFENRCPTVSRISMPDFDALVEATLTNQLKEDVQSNEPKIQVSAHVSRWAF